MDSGDSANQNVFSRNVNAKKDKFSKKQDSKVGSKLCKRGQLGSDGCGVHNKTICIPLLI